MFLDIAPSRVKNLYVHSEYGTTVWASLSVDPKKC